MWLRWTSGEIFYRKVCDGKGCQSRRAGKTREEMGYLLHTGSEGLLSSRKKYCLHHRLPNSDLDIGAPCRKTVSLPWGHSAKQDWRFTLRERNLFMVPDGIKAGESI